MKDDLGELVDDYSDIKQSSNPEESNIYSEDESDQSEDQDAVIEEREGLDLTKHSPFYEIDAKDDPSHIIFCSTCGRQIPSQLLVIEGECSKCAKKRLRRIESALVATKQLKPTRKFCIMDGHAEILDDKFHPEWNKISIFGEDFYPPQQLCSTCVSQLRTFFTRYLEDRGITRYGCGNTKNEWILPKDRSVPTVQILEDIRAFKDFMSAVSVYALDSESGMNDLHKEVSTAYKQIMKKEVNRKCQEKLNLTELRLQKYPILHLLQEKEGLDKLSSELQSAELLKDGLPEEVRQDVVRLLVQNLKLVFVTAPKMYGEKLNLPVLLNLTLEEAQKMEPILMKALQSKAEYYLGPHAIFATSVLQDALNQFKTLISTLE